MLKSILYWSVEVEGYSLFIYLFICLVIYLFLSWKEHKIKSKWNEKEIKIEIYQIEINFTFVIWRNKRTKWKVCILFPIISIWLKFSFLIHCQRTFMGCNIIVSNYYLIVFEFEYEYLLLFVFELTIFEMQIKKYN